MEINKKVYKYISVISFIIVVTLSINLMFPTFTKAEGNYIKAQPNDDSTVKIQVVIDNIYKEISKLYIIKADDLAVPKTEEELAKFEADYTANSIIEYLNNTNNEFIKPIEEPGKYYAVVVLKKRSQNNPDDEIYVTAMSATYTYTVNKDENTAENDSKTENKAEDKQNVNENKAENNQESNKDENKDIKNNEEEKKVEENKDNKEENKTENTAKEIVEEVMQIRVNQGQEQAQNSDEYQELTDINETKTENQNDNKEETKKETKKEAEIETKIESQKESQKETEIKSQPIEKTVQNEVIDNTMFMNKTGNKSQQKLPQTGEDDTSLKIAIAIFSIIGLASFAKYKSMK